MSLVAISLGESISQQYAEKPQESHERYSGTREWHLQSTPSQCLSVGSNHCEALTGSRYGRADARSKTLYHRGMSRGHLVTNINVSVIRQAKCKCTCLEEMQVSSQQAECLHSWSCFRICRQQLYRDRTGTTEPLHCRSRAVDSGWCSCLLGSEKVFIQPSNTTCSNLLTARPPRPSSREYSRCVAWYWQPNNNKEEIRYTHNN